MKTTDKIDKRRYKYPIVEKIEIDKDISLKLASAPPIGPSETNNFHDSTSKDPFKVEMV